MKIVTQLVQYNRDKKGTLKRPCNTKKSATCINV